MFLLVKTRGEPKLIETYSLCHNVFEFVGKYFCFLGTNFVSATMFPEVSKQENIYMGCFRENISIETINIS